MLDINKLYLMDCLVFLDQIDDETIDLAIIDPPYNMKMAKWDTYNTKSEYFTFTFSWLDKLIKKVKITGSLYLFNTPYNSAYILPHLENQGMAFQNWITWDKRDGMAAIKTKYNRGQETILFFTKSYQYTFKSDDIRIPYESTERIAHAQKKGILKNGKRWFPNPKGKLCTEVWHFSSERHRNKTNGKTPKLLHVTPKPINMLERMILASSNAGDLVLDCFIGTGATAIAAKRLNRNYIGCDLDREYLEYANKKLNEMEVQC